MTDLPPMEQVAADLAAQDAETGPISVEVDAFVAFCLVGQLQIAARHPGNCGPSLGLAARVAAALSDKLPESAQAVIRAGWNPENDVEAEAPHGN